MPEIGHPESYYAKLAKRAEKDGNHHLHEAAKVGQYVTLALDHSLEWTQKLRYFRHALARHCVPPAFAGDSCWKFYRDLADIVREHAGREALRIASLEDDLYAARREMGQHEEKIAGDAEVFFQKIMGDFSECPEWFSHEDWEQLRLLRDQWV
jgi:hypothetical protein